MTLAQWCAYGAKNFPKEARDLRSLLREYAIGAEWSWQPNALKRAARYRDLRKLFTAKKAK